MERGRKYKKKAKQYGHKQGNEGFMLLCGGRGEGEGGVRQRYRSWKPTGGGMALGPKIQISCIRLNS
jgi:hypothetical protein